MKVIDYLLAFALLTAALSALYSALLRWLRTPLRDASKARRRKQSPAEPSRSAHVGTRRRSVANHAFSR
jgi:hypothetical protein